MTQVLDSSTRLQRQYAARYRVALWLFAAGVAIVVTWVMSKSPDFARLFVSMVFYSTALVVNAVAAIVMVVIPVAVAFLPYLMFSLLNWKPRIPPTPKMRFWTYLLIGVLTFTGSFLGQSFWGDILWIIKPLLAPYDPLGYIITIVWDVLVIVCVSFFIEQADTRPLPSLIDE